MNQFTRTSLILACLGLMLLLPASADAQATAPYSRTIIVSAVPGSPIASGTNLLNAVAAATPTSGDRWLIKIEPGIYNVRSTYVFMKEYMDIEGSGVGVTRVLGNPYTPSGSTIYEGVFNGADNSELRNLSVFCGKMQISQVCVPVHNFEADVSLRDLRLEGKALSNGTLYGVRNFWSSIRMENVAIDLAGGSIGYGILNRGPAPYSHVTVRNSSIRVVDATSQNIGIGNRDGSTVISVSNTSIFVDGGSKAIGMTEVNPSFSSGVVPVFNDVEIEVGINTGTGYGFYENTNDIEVYDSTIKVGGTLYSSVAEQLSSGAVYRFQSCQLEAEDYWVVSWSGSGVFSSRLLGTATTIGATCAGVTDQAFAFYPSTCP